MTTQTDDQTTTSSAETAGTIAGAPAGQAPVSADPWDAIYNKAEAAVTGTEDSFPGKAASSESQPQGESSAVKNLEAGEKPSQDQAATSAGDGLVIPSADAGQAQALEHWKPEVRAQFDALPDDSKPLVMDFYKGMQASFTQGMQALREQQRELGELLSLQDQFRADPKAVLANLAKSAGVEIYLERPLPEGQIPQFETIQEAMLWAKQEAKREVMAELGQERAANEQKQQAQRTEQEFVADLQAAAAKYPDFVSHKDGIMSALAANSSLSAEQAYQLATYQGLRKLAIEGQSAKTQIAKLTKELETLKAGAGNPGAAGTGKAVPPAASSPADPWDAIYAKAEQSVAASQSQH